MGRTPAPERTERGQRPHEPMKATIRLEAAQLLAGLSNVDVGDVLAVANLTADRVLGNASPA